MPIDRGATESLTSQVTRGLRALIVGGTLPSGLKLPGSRALAQRLGVSRNTALDAYAALVSEGWATTKSGSGTFVAQLQRMRAEPRAARSAEQLLSARGRAIVDDWSGWTGMDAHRILAVGIPALDQFPHEDWNRAMARGARAFQHRVIACEDPRGWEPLREAIASHLGAARGIICDPHQVIILTSARQAVFLAARLLTNVGDRVWVEDPGYPEATSALLAADVRPAFVPVDHEGIDVAAALRRAPDARLAIVTPSHQFPLGVVMSAARRVALQSWARAHHAYIVEDDYDGEFRHGGTPIPALAGSLDRDRIIYVGTFSKSLFPALRIAYLVSPPHLADAFAAARATLDAHTSTPAQAGLAEFIQSGAFGRHVRSMRTLYTERRAALMSALDTHLREAASVEPTDFGLHLVAKFRARESDVRVSEALQRTRCRAKPLSPYYAQAERAEHGFVLGYAGSTPAEIDRGVRAIAAAIAKVAPRKRR